MLQLLIHIVNISNRCTSREREVRRKKKRLMEEFRKFCYSIRSLIRCGQSKSTSAQNSRWIPYSPAWAFKKWKKERRRRHKNWKFMKSIESSLHLVCLCSLSCKVWSDLKSVWHRLAISKTRRGSSLNCRRQPQFRKKNTIFEHIILYIDHIHAEFAAT